MPSRNSELDPALLDRLRAEPAAAVVAAALFRHSSLHDDVPGFLTAGLPLVVEALRAEYAAVAGPEAGRWGVLADAGRKQSLPAELLADVLDRDRVHSTGGWAAAPLEHRNPAGEVLAVKLAGPAVGAAQQQTLATLAALLGQAVATVRQRRRELRRVRRLEAMLKIAGDWNQTREMEPLLVQMAEAATHLLGTDRASIFLWDRPNKLLVGRPALGVPGGELRIPDDKGIVGQVLQSGQPRRVDLTNNQEQINRQVDTQTGYQTKTLLGVPLRGKTGELFGVFEVINKLQGNFTDDDEAALVELAGHAAISLENTQERTQLLEARRQITEQAAKGVRLVGETPAIAALRSTIGRVAATDLAVLVLGENGTGKEVVSQSIHYQSQRRDQPFIAVNCAAISETLLESELFGHEKGAFTDAHTARPGKFELASGGTIFLDEIGDLSAAGQAKLLRVLEEKVVVRVGGSKTIHTDARVIAATNQNLGDMVRQKRFRQDLFFRLNVVTLELPPLRDRPDDILRLAEFFLSEFSKKARRKLPKFTDRARQRLVSHRWPGNIRELRNMMERLAYLSQEETIDVQDLGLLLGSDGMSPTSDQHAPGSSSAASQELPLAQATDLFQIEHIKLAIARARGNMSDAAELLGLHRSNLYRKMRQLGLATDEP